MERQLWKQYLYPFAACCVLFLLFLLFMCSAQLSCLIYCSVHFMSFIHSLVNIHINSSCESVFVIICLCVLWPSASFKFFITGQFNNSAHQKTAFVNGLNFLLSLIDSRLSRSTHFFVIFHWFTKTVEMLVVRTLCNYLAFFFFLA